MRLFVVLVGLVVIGGPAAHASCRSRVVVVHRQAVVQQVVTPAFIAVPVVVPAYSVGYQPQQQVVSDYGELVEVLREIRDALANRTPVQQTTFAAVVQTRCVKCHDAAKAAASGGDVVLWDKGKAPPFSVVEKRLLRKVIEGGNMPPRGELPLTDAEKKAFLDGVK